MQHTGLINTVYACVHLNKPLVEEKWPEQMPPSYYHKHNQINISLSLSIQILFLSLSAAASSPCDFRLGFSPSFLDGVFEQKSVALWKEGGC